MDDKCFRSWVQVQGCKPTMLNAVKSLGAARVLIAKRLPQLPPAKRQTAASWIERRVVLGDGREGWEFLEPYK
jgi:hypothetical protein